MHENKLFTKTSCSFCDRKCPVLITIDFAKEVKANYYSLSVLAPYYGTELFNDLMAKGHALDKQPWEYFFHQSPELMVNNTISPGMLKKFLELNQLNQKNNSYL